MQALESCSRVMQTPIFIPRFDIYSDNSVHFGRSTTLCTVCYVSKLQYPLENVNEITRIVFAIEMKAIENAEMSSYLNTSSN